MRAGILGQTAMVLRLDHEAVRVSEALHQSGIRSLLLKGPAIQRWLYGDAFRVYGDIDLMVRGNQYTEAVSVLADCGFHDPAPGIASAEVGRHARPYVSSEGVCVDLHTSLNTAEASADAVWSALTANMRWMDLAGGRVTVCGPDEQLALLVMHAAQHGGAEEKPLQDLRRVAALVSASDLKSAREVAARMGALASFAAGLRLYRQLTMTAE